MSPVNSPRMLEGFLGLYGALGASSLDPAKRERIAHACQGLGMMR